MNMLIEKTKKDLIIDDFYDQLEDDIKVRGRPITCKVCSAQFKIPADKKTEWENARLPCINCRSEYCCLPQTERELRIEQDRFLLTKNQDYLTNIYVICVPYCRSMLLKCRWRYVLNNDERIDYHATEMAKFLIEEYCKSATFIIHKSFGKWLSRKIPQTLFGKDERTVERTQDISLDSEYGHLLEGQNTQINEIENSQSTLEVRDYLLKLILEIGTYCKNNEEKFSLFLNLRNHLKYGERITDLFFRLNERKGKIVFEKSLLIMKEELQELISTH